jgi:hypothetical protein
MDQRFVKEGPGWRIGWDQTASTYQGMVAGDTWALELTGQEFQDFCRLAQQLVDTLQAMAAELMDQERITCEAESDLLWVEADGFPDQYSLRFILNTGRRCEGQWTSEATQGLMQSLGSLGVF